MKCPACGGEISALSNACPACRSSLAGAATVGVLTPLPVGDETVITPSAANDDFTTRLPSSLPPDPGESMPTLPAGTPATALQPGPPASGPRGPLEPGQPFGSRYHVIRLLGLGGMGAVYQAWDAELGVVVAIKVIRR